MTDIERKAAFYLGKIYDPHAGQVIADQPVMYDARDLTTHAVCIGMTGSGKTGLGVTLLEEAVLDGIPSIVIDPKGDMTNLLLTFPELRPADFEPWINLDDARRKDQTASEYAAATSETWARGIAAWGQSGERIRRLKDAAEFVIYTPGSDAGVQVSVLQTLRAPNLSWDDDEETLRELIAGTVSGLLGLAGVSGDPLQSREHILLSHIFEHHWRRGQDLDLAKLIEAIQRPPIAKLGVLNVETFYPEKDRFLLALALNRVVASPSFENWLKGVALDIDSLLYTPAGKPRVCIFYIAHLNDAERMFFVTLLLEQMLSWVRRLSGTTSLRALLYFDEVFGYFPPHPANPPCKRPLLTLLKMARAFGLGLMLTTQNPVDLDYKGLTNAGAWFIGKLQTDRDKARVLEGMEGVVSEANTLLDRAYLDRLISSLGSRVFVLHNVHAERPILYQTRWALSYLRGPLTRSQVRTLMQPLKAQAAHAPGAAPAAGEAATPARPAVTAADAVAAPAGATQGTALPAGYAAVPPRINARVAQYYWPVDLSQQQATRLLRGARQTWRVRAAHLVYEPYLVGLASALFGDARSGQTQQEEVACLLPLPSLHGLLRWERHIAPAFDDHLLERDPEPGALYAALPEGMGETPPYTQLRNDFVDYIYRERTVPRWVHPHLKLQSQLGESREAFLARCRAQANTQRDQELEKIRQRGKASQDRLQAQLERAERSLEDQSIAFKGRQQEELLSAGETIAGMLLGKTTVGKLLGTRRTTALSSASRRRRMTAAAKANLKQAEDEVARLKSELAAALKDQENALAQVLRAWEGVAEQIDEAVMRPRKTDIRPGVFGLLWMPHWALTLEDERGAVQEQVAPACRLLTSGT
jgi:hypothetical protein